jgi:hypothetical protein
MFAFRYRFTFSVAPCGAREVTRYDTSLRPSSPNLYRSLPSKHNIAARCLGASMSTGGILIERIRSIVRAGASTSRRNLDSVRAPIVSWMINGKPTSYVRSRGSLFSNSTMFSQQVELRKSGRRRSKRIAWRSSLIVLSSSSTRRDVSTTDPLSASIAFGRRIAPYS